MSKPAVLNFVCSKTRYDGAEESIDKEPQRAKSAAGIFHKREIPPQQKPAAQPPVNSEPFQAPDGRRVINRLREAIGCPIYWEKRFEGAPRFCKDLRLYWVQIARKHETDGEMRFYSRLDVELTLNEGWLRQIEINTPYWRQDAVNEYKNRAQFLLKLKFATTKEQTKHYPHPKWSRDEIVAKTTRSDALFFHEFKEINLEQMCFESIHQRLVTVLESRPAHLYVQYPEPVGGSHGAEASLIRFDLDYGTPLAHGHPIQSKELPAGADLITEPQCAFPDVLYDEFYHDIDELDDETITPRRDNPML